MKHKIVRSVFTILLGAAAVFGFANCVPIITSLWQGTPFIGALVPMLLLPMAVLVSSLLAAATVFSRHAWSVFLATVASLIMIAWSVFLAAAAVQQSSWWQWLFMATALIVIALAEYLWMTEFRAKPISTLKHRVIRVALAVIEAFIGLGAIGGGFGLLRGVVFNYQVPLAWLAGTPFSDYTIPGLMLVMAVGGSALLAAATVFIDREWAVLVSLLAGLLMVGYLVVEIVTIDSKVGDALPIALGAQLFYFVLGLLIFGLAGYLWMRDYRHQHFHISHAGHA
jgi:hypothetical protein